MKWTALSVLMLAAVLAAGAQQPTENAVATNARQVIQDLVAGNFGKVEAQYDAKMAAALPPGKLSDGFATITQQVGAFQSIVSTNTSKVQGLDVAKLVCKFASTTLDATVAYDPDGKIAGLGFRPHQEAATVAPWTPPAYVTANSFTEQALELHNGDYVLPGTLTLPKGSGPFPAVVLVQGSGPHDQDETIGPNKTFKDLAWGLASRGIAVYRYTKRTQQYGTKSSTDPTKLTVEEETISDARAAVELLSKQGGVNSKQIFVVGHSLGAYLAPRIATKNELISGIVLMGANTKPLEQVVVDQIRYLAGTGEASSAEGEQQLAAAQKAAAQIESPDLKPGDTVPFIGATTYGAYWLDLRDYDPVKTAAKLKIPILILQGGRDYQVTPANFADWRTALGRKPNVTLKLFPDANHLFEAGTGASTPAEYDKPGHVEQPVIDAIAAFVLPTPNPGSLKGISN
jgi:dienelactone hydrolase